jgi:hypothetical protein
MKGRQKITRIHLDDRTDGEYTVLGLVSVEADYKLSQLLNKKLKIALRNSKTLDITSVDGVNMNFSRYSDISGAPEITYNLISNKSEKVFLLKKLKNIDYFLQIHTIDKKCDISQLTITLREIERITGVFRIDPLEIKDKNMMYLTL